MGRLIAFWSPWHGQSKTTASMAAIAMAMNGINGDRVALFHTQSMMADLEGMFNNRMDSRKKVKLYEGAGLNSLLLTFKQAEITNDIVDRAAFPTFIEDVKFLPGLEMDDEMAKMDDVREILYTLAVRDIPNAYDWTFVDLSSGKDPLSFRIMEKADVVVVTLSQNVAVWNQFFDEYEEYLPAGKIFYLFGGHKQESSYCAKNFRRIYRIDKKKCGVVPDCVAYMDAISNGRVASFYLMNENAQKSEENGLFIREIKDAAKKISVLAYEETKGGAE